MAKYKANRKRFRVENYFSKANDPNGKIFVGTSYHTSTKKAISKGLENQSLLSRNGYNPLGIHYTKDEKKYKVKDSTYSKHRKWIRNILKNSNITQGELYTTVGLFSNKSKEKVMKEKNISSSEYDKRREFLFKVFCLLESEKFD